MRADRPSDFSRIVSTQRHELGLTQQQLAERAGVSRQLVARLENGTGDPALSNVLRVLSALGLKLDAAPPSTPKIPATSPIPTIKLPADLYSSLIPKIDPALFITKSLMDSLQQFPASYYSTMLSALNPPKTQAPGSQKDHSDGDESA